jgi:GntR family transcriptional regulator
MAASSRPRRTLPAAALRVDDHSKLPAVRQIVERVRQLAAIGVLQRGDRLPTVRAAARAAGIHFNTFARAYRTLDRTGVLSTQRGRGTFVVAVPRRRRSRQSALHTLARSFVAECSAWQASPAEMRSALDKALASDRVRRAKDT